MAIQNLAQTNKTDKTKRSKITPAERVAENHWRKICSWDAAEAHRLRQTLCDVGCYPTSDTTGDKGNDFGDGHARALVHAAIDEMSRPDAEAMARVARLLLLVEREPDLFKRIEEDIRAFEVNMKARGIWKTGARA